MKVRLLNDGGYKSLKSLKFPFVVEGIRYGDMIEVRGDQIHLGDHRDVFSFVLETECEVIDEE